MDDVDGPWSCDRAERFLRNSRIPIRLGCHTPGGGLWILSLWYRYRDGRLECATGADARVVEYLREDPGVAFEVSTNDPPYKGVRGAGRADLESDEDKATLRADARAGLRGRRRPRDRPHVTP
jgi:nitroimidazol reductase NimA-like FMN-containing flavoprotein (pyridoxamine 5'-phosphate oxidase superfamily)